ncbi:hypothetical protein [Paucisalibacillus globulus]|nr:hypothetical protein [Paucisalibacillus globulus]
MSKVLSLQAMDLKKSASPDGLFFSTNSMFVCCSNTIASTMSMFVC